MDTLPAPYPPRPVPSRPHILPARMSKRIIVTSALPYANGPIHFGHVVGAYLPADIYVRYRRMCGDDVPPYGANGS